VCVKVSRREAMAPKGTLVGEKAGSPERHTCRGYCTEQETRPATLFSSVEGFKAGSPERHTSRGYRAGNPLRYFGAGSKKSA